MKKLKSISWRNWNKRPSNLLVTLIGIQAVLASFQNMILSVVHSAPFPVPHAFDEYFVWIMQVWALVLVILAAFTKRSDIDITAKIEDVTKTRPPGLSVHPKKSNP